MVRSVFAGAGLVIILSSLLFAEVAYDGGSGTAGDPYRISTPSQLDEMGQRSENWGEGTYFLLTNDLDMSGYDGVEERPAFHRIGLHEQHPFAGIFDGGGHTISNLTINIPETHFAGLFGWVEGAGSEIKNVGIINAKIIGDINAGALVAVNRNADISNCFVTGSVTGNAQVGGLAGYNGGNITNCYSVCKVVSGHDAGGLMGRCDLGRITNCYVSGAVSGIAYAGAITGTSNGGTYSGCFYDNTIAELADTGIGNVSGIDDLSSAAMTDETIYSSAGWDFVNDWQMQCPSWHPRLKWEMSYFGGSGSVSDPFRVSSEEGLYRLGLRTDNWKDGTHFLLTNDIDMSGYDGFDGRPVFNRIGPDYDHPFAGVFDGGGHTISNLRIYIPQTHYAGLFGWVEGTGPEIKNVGIVNADITGNINAGALVAHNCNAIISSCFVSGSVTGSAHVGGLAGFNGDTIADCYSTVRVSSGADAGGLIGRCDYGTVINCYVDGSVSELSENVTDVISWQRIELGGFTAINNDGIYFDCFWNDNDFWDNLEDSYSKGDIDGIEAVRTSKLKMRETYVSAGWDFDNIWKMMEPSWTPHLMWENTYSRWPYDGGEGTVERPFRIATAEQLAELGKRPQDWDKHFIMIADIDMSGYNGVYGNPGFTPIGTDSMNTFNGIFDGAGHVISNLVIDQPDSEYVGLFGYITMPEDWNAPPSNSNGEVVGLDEKLIYDFASIKNLGIENAYVIGDSFVGILAGKNRGYIINCYSKGNVTGQMGHRNNDVSCTGGLVGYSVIRYYKDEIGGIINSYSDADVTGKLIVGGLVGRNCCIIENCYATGNVEAMPFGSFNSFYAGGLVGENCTFINNCYAVGSVTISLPETGNWDFFYGGGLIGHNTGDISNCYAGGKVSGTEHPSGLEESLGGFAGYSYQSSAYSGCFWDKTVNAGLMDVHRRDVDGIEGVSSSEMMDSVTFAGWDFKGAWLIDEGASYPYLCIEDPYAGGSGTASDPYLISEAWQLDYLGKRPWDWYDGKHFLLVNDIDFSAYDGINDRPVFNHIGPSYENPFAGVFDGGGHTISNLTLNMPDTHYMGLFGWVEGGDAEIKNLGMVNADITGNINAGALVGANHMGKINNCFTTGSVSGHMQIGGLAGFSGGNVNNCYSRTTVTCNNYGGGLLGRCDLATISNCYSASTVSGGVYTGGFTGSDNWAIYSGCFCDTSNSDLADTGYGDVAGIDGVGTAGMMHEQTYTAQGWDFDSCWKIWQDHTYPRLMWQIYASDFSGDDRVTQEDIAMFADMWMIADGDVEWDETYDISPGKDGIINLQDFAIVAREYIFSETF